MAICFLILVFAAKNYALNHLLLSPLWVTTGTLCMGMGEVLLMPVLLSLVTKDSPEHMKNAMVGFLYLCISFSSYLAGVIAKLTSSMAAGDAIMGFYKIYWLVFAGSLVVAALLFLADQVLKVRVD
jgi:POT family proton-dependent oligopeptide transporter